jgi:hypothetical protein
MNVRQQTQKKNQKTRQVVQPAKQAPEPAGTVLRSSQMEQPGLLVGLPDHPTNHYLRQTAVLHMQEQKGNAAVQRLLTASPDVTIQRFGLNELWEGVKSVANTAWGSLTQPAGAAEKKKGVAAESLQAPSGAFTITDSQAVIRQPPPSLTAKNGKPQIPQGTQVELLEVARKNGKYYVNVRDFLAPDQQGPLRDFGWTAAGNINGLPSILASLNPQTVDEPGQDVQDIVAPRPSQGGLPGLPAKPDLEFPEFLAIAQEMEEMEQNPLAVETKHGEEVGDERKKRVEKIANLRQRIAALQGIITAPDQLKEAQAYLYRRLAPLAPYLGQMANTNILEKDSKGWDRTCNVTVPAMVLEGLGKTKDDYAPAKLPLLRRIFDALEGKYKQRKVYEAASDFDALRFPDFMALIGIARHVPEGNNSTDEQFIKAVSKARKTAAAQTTAHATMMYLIEQFKANHKKHSVYSKELGTIGKAQKQYTKEQLRGKNPENWRELYNRIEAISSAEEKTAAYKKLSKEDQKRYKTVWDYEQFNKEKADELLPVDNYRQAVLKKINPLLDKGAQILVGMQMHFVRLDGLDQERIQVDDPGEKGFKNLQVTWEQARNLGYFKTFWEITD